MTPALASQIQHLLLADETVDGSTLHLVDAACSGDAPLAAALAELDTSASPPPRDTPPRATTPPPGCYLSQITIAGFRGIGPERTLSLPPGPGLTLILGRNGSGKSSFVEGLETLLTGESRRWADRPAQWQAGWKNLHTDAGSSVEATFAVEGGEPVVARRGWKAGADLSDSQLRVRRGSDKLDDLGALGWSDPLATFRPFLSYSELGALLDRPSELYDKLKGILGLDALAHAIKRLTDARKSRDGRRKASKRRRDEILAQLESVAEDPRAQRCREAISGRKWDLTALESVLLGDDEDDTDDAVKLLRALVQITCPSVDEIGTLVTQLREAIAAKAELADTSAAANAELAKLLEQALHYCEASTQDCPVCGSELTDGWAAQTRARLEDTKARAQKVVAADTALTAAHKSLRAKIRAAPRELSRVAEVDLSDDLLVAWRAWVDVPESASQLGDHAEDKILELVAAREPFVAQARDKLEAMQSAWRPVALELAAWLEAAKTVEAESTAFQALTKAEKWLKQAEGTLRDDRFAPIAARAQEIWNALRQQSSVDLARVKLSGKGTRRRVELNVTIDGQEGVAVSVMSQGELNALALSLFLPRMTSAESPFHFLVIDDPVQAMDPHKVDGLARVLEQVAATRQVLVFTHDARLYEAVRRLGISAHVVEVQRRSSSVVELVDSLDPVERHLKDALTIAGSEQPIGRKVVGRLVPGFCRLAMEAACIEAIRRRRLGRGDAHADVEKAIEDAKGLHPLAALALYDDTARTGDVFAYLKNKQGDWAADTFRAVKESTHSGYRGPPLDLVRDSRKIARVFQEVR